MGWIGFGTFAAAALLAFATGDRIGRADRRTRCVGAAVLLALLVGSVALHRLPLVAERLFPLSVYVPLRPWAPAVLGVGFLSAAIPQLPDPGPRRALGLLASALFLFVLQRAAATALRQPDDFRGVPDPVTGVCPQTTTFSCGAAAASTLLARLGIHSTESEMARRCATNLFTGTDELGVLKGVREKLVDSPFSAELVRADPDLLRAIDLPIAVAVTRGPFLGHWLVVVGGDGSTLILADPQNDAEHPSLRTEPFAKLASELRGWMVRLRRTPGLARR